jgi:hypothetical protein
LTKTCLEPKRENLGGPPRPDGNLGSPLDERQPEAAKWLRLMVEHQAAMEQIVTLHENDGQCRAQHAKSAVQKNERTCVRSLQVHRRGSVRAVLTARERSGVAGGDHLELLTVQQVAELTGLSVETLNQWRSQRLYLPDIKRAR